MTIKTIYTDEHLNIYCFTCAVKRINTGEIIKQQSYFHAGIMAVPDFCVDCGIEL